MKNCTSKVKLSDVAIIIMGQSPKGETYNNVGNGIPLLNGPTEFGVHHPESTSYTTDSKKECKNGDLIFCVRGSTTGRMNWADRIYSLGRGVCSIRGETNRDTKYIRYCLEMYLKELLNFAGGGTFPNLTKDDILSFQIPYPETKGKIASILSAYDDLIENNTRRIKILEEMAQLIYKEWFVKFRFPGHEKCKFVDSELGKIPEGWAVRNLEKLVDAKYGYTESATDEPVGPKFLRGTDINKTSFIDWNSVPYCTIPNDKKDKYKLIKGDILIIRMADPGKVAIIEKDIDTIFGSYLIRLRITDKIIKPYFLFYTLMSDIYQNYVLGASTGTTRKSISSGLITNVNIILADQNLINKFENAIEQIRLTLNILNDKNKLLRQTRDILLLKLINGELDVEDLEILEE